VSRIGLNSSRYLLSRHSGLDPESILILTAHRQRLYGLRLGGRSDGGLVEMFQQPNTPQAQKNPRQRAEG
jgi:hypothetical protein